MGMSQSSSSKTDLFLTMGSHFPKTGKSKIVTRDSVFFFNIKSDTFIRIIFGISDYFWGRTPTQNALTCNHPQEKAVALAAPAYN